MTDDASDFGDGPWDATWWSDGRTVVVKISETSQRFGWLRQIDVMDHPEGGGGISDQCPVWGVEFPGDDEVIALQGPEWRMASESECAAFQAELQASMGNISQEEKEEL